RCLRRLLGGCRVRRGRRVGRGGGGGGRGVAAEAYAYVRVLELEVGQAVLREELGQLANLFKVEHGLRSALALRLPLLGASAAAATTAAPVARRSAALRLDLRRGRGACARASLLAALRIVLIARAHLMPPSLARLAVI